ncbi:MAG: helix-turn-helix domain-containing protein [Thermoplasmatota archaeon]
MASRARRGVLRAVLSHPGAHLRELEAITALGMGGLRHHLDRLERDGLVRHEFDLRFKRYYPTGLDPTLGRAMAVLRQAPLLRVARLMAKHPGLRVRDLSKRSSIPLSSLYGYLKRLERVGVATCHAGEWTLARGAAAALAQVRAGPVDRLVDRALALMEERDRLRP